MLLWHITCKARDPRGFIEIAKCVIFRTNCANINVTNSRGNARFWAALIGISGDSRSFLDFI